MAYGDVGSFMPSETSFRGDPGSYMAQIKGQATKRATYLSQMDQFYTQLEEEARQFDIGHELEQLKFGLEEERLDWEREYGTGMLEIEGRKVDVTQELGLGELDVRKGELGVQRQQLSLSAIQGQQSYNLAREEMDLARDKLESGEKIAQQAIRTAGPIYTGTGSTTTEKKKTGGAIYSGGELIGWS